MSFAYPAVLVLLVAPAMLLAWVWRREGPRVALPFDHGRQAPGQAWKALIGLARKETDRQMKREILQKLSIMNDDDAVAYAIKRFENAARHVHEPILFARVALAVSGPQERWQPASAQMALDVNGDPVRAEAQADTMLEAIDLVVDRVREQLRHRHERRLARRRPA